MNQIAKTNTSLCPSLSDIQKDMVLAQSGLKCRQIEDNDLRSELIKIFGEMYLSLRWETPKAAELLLMADLLINDYIRKHFENFTISEIRMVCKNGIAKIYGDFAGASAATVATWLHKHLGSNERTEARKLQENYMKELNKPKELTPEEKEKIVHDGALKLFEDFKVSGHVFDGANVTYNYLDRKGKIPFTNEMKRSFMAAARGHIVEINKASLLEKGTDRSKIKAFLKSLESGNEEARVIAEAKRIALNTLFKDLVDTSTELTDLIY